MPKWFFWSYPDIRFISLINVAQVMENQSRFRGREELEREREYRERSNVYLSFLLSYYILLYILSPKCLFRLCICWTTHIDSFSSRLFNFITHQLRSFHLFRVSTSFHHFPFTLLDQIKNLSSLSQTTFKTNSFIEPESVWEPILFCILHFRL